MATPCPTGARKSPLGHQRASTARRRCKTRLSNNPVRIPHMRCWAQEGTLNTKAQGTSPRSTTSATPTRWGWSHSARAGEVRTFKYSWHACPLEEEKLQEGGGGAQEGNNIELDVQEETGEKGRTPRTPRGQRPPCKRGPTDITQRAYHTPRGARLSRAGHETDTTRGEGQAEKSPRIVFDHAILGEEGERETVAI